MICGVVGGGGNKRKHEGYELQLYDCSLLWVAFKHGLFLGLDLKAQIRICL